MLETFKYINHLNEVIEFGKDGIYVDYNTLRDYSWDITSANNKIASFKKGIVSKTIPIIIKCNSEAEGIEIKNRLFEVFEKDVLAKKNGKIIIGDYYLKCFITGTKKTKYLIDKGYLHLSLTMKTDYPAWIKETYSIFRPKSALNTSESAEGREILIGNATNSILTNYAVCGRSEQKSYKGINLVNFVSPYELNTAKISNYKFDNETGLVSFDYNNTYGSVNFLCNHLAGKTIYSFIKNETNTNTEVPSQGILIRYADSSGKITQSDVNPNEFTIPSDAVGVRVFISGNNSNTAYSGTFSANVMISSEASETYEKFVGGEPSPNPSYPQPIESVADKGKNQIENSAISQTINGVKFVVHSDGSVTVNGTATADTELQISEQILPVGDYIATGGCDGNCDLRCNLVSGGTVILCGEGNPFDVQVPSSATTLKFYVYVPSGATVTNKTVYPMVRKADIADDTYEPPYNFLWVNTNSKNSMENKATTQTVKGVTFTVNYDGSITANGSNTGDYPSDMYLIPHNNQILIPAGTYILSGCPSGGSETAYALLIGNYTDGVYTRLGIDIGNGAEITFKEDTEIYVLIRIQKNQTVSNLTFKPMIRLASIDDDSYAPYNATQATIILNDSLRGIKVTEGGNFTDETGQQWVCDTLEKYADGSGKLVQRVYSKTFNGSETWTPYSANNGFYQFYTHISNCKNFLNVMCSHLTTMELTDRTTKTGVIKYNDKVLRFAFQPSYNITTTEEFTTWLSNNNVTVFYELADYIETPLTAEQIAEIEKLQTFEGVTYITNNDDAYQTATYSIMQYLDFPYGYEYDFTADFDSDELLNTSFVPVDFKMVIHGAVTNPSVFISGHEYNVDVVVEEGDYLTIDSQQKTIVLSKKDGTQVNCFNYRNRDSYVFEKIPSGKNEITSANDLNIDITLLDERSEPRWT